MEASVTYTSREQQLIRKAALHGVPLNATFELLPLCNLDCKMCYVHRSRLSASGTDGLQPLSFWVRTAQQLQKAGTLFVTLTGGEPLLYPGFRELCTSLRDLGMIITVNTNGTLLDEAWADFFAALKPRRVNITLYGTCPETYQKICGHGDGYEKAVHAVRLLTARRVAVKLNASIVPDNLPELDALYEAAAALGVPMHADTYMIPPLPGILRESFERLSPEAAAAAALASMKHELDADAFSEHLRRTAAKLRDYGKDGTYTPSCISCLAGSCALCVTWQGTIKPCVSMIEPAIPVMEADILQQWRQLSCEAKKLRMNEACTRCPNRPVCSICPAAAKLETGRYDGIPDYLCRYAAAYAALIKKELTSDDES